MVNNEDDPWSSFTLGEIELYPHHGHWRYWQKDNLKKSNFNQYNWKIMLKGLFISHLSL